MPLSVRGVPSKYESHVQTDVDVAITISTLVLTIAIGGLVSFSLPRESRKAGDRTLLTTVKVVSCLESVLWWGS